MPTVSVMMPAYNAENFIEESIQSVLNQTYKDFELIILDDGSTDNTFKIAAAYAAKDSRIRVIQNEGNKGLSFTRNRLFKEAKAPLLAILDSDDLSVPERLAWQVDYLERNPDVGVLGGGVIYFDENNPIKATSIRLSGVTNIPIRLLFQNVMGQSTIMMRKAYAELEYRNDFPPAEDYDLWVRASFETKIDNLPKVLIHYREHGNNISVRKREIIKQNTKKIIAYQLERLGLPTNDQAMQIHQHLVGFHLPINEDNLNNSLDWLLSIWEANQKQNFYHPEAVKKEFAFRLEQLITRSLDLGKPCASTLAKHPIIKIVLNKKEIRKYIFLAKAKEKNTFESYLLGLYKRIRA